MKTKYIIVYACDPLGNNDQCGHTTALLQQVLDYVTNTKDGVIWIVMFASNAPTSPKNVIELKHFMYNYCVQQLSQKGYEASLATKSAEFVKDSFWDRKQSSVALQYPCTPFEGCSESDIFEYMLRKHHADTVIIAAAYDDLVPLKKEWKYNRGFAVEDAITYIHI